MQVTGSPLSAMHCASSNAVMVLPTPPLPCSTKCRWRVDSPFAEEALSVVRLFERVVVEGSTDGGFVSGMGQSLGWLGAGSGTTGDESGMGLGVGVGLRSGGGAGRGPWYQLGVAGVAADELAERLIADAERRLVALEDGR